MELAAHAFGSPGGLQGSARSSRAGRGSRVTATALWSVCVRIRNACMEASGSNRAVRYQLCSRVLEQQRSPAGNRSAARPSSSVSLPSGRRENVLPLVREVKTGLAIISVS